MSGNSLNAIEQRPQYMSAADVRRFFGNVSAMWIVRRLADSPDFPKPIKFGPGKLAPRYWRACEIEQWAVSRAKAGA